MSGFYDENGLWRSGRVGGTEHGEGPGLLAVAAAEEATRRVREKKTTARVELPRLLRDYPALKAEVVIPGIEHHPLKDLAGLYAEETLY